MRNEIKNFLLLVFVSVLLEICMDSEVYATDSITGKFSIKTQDEQELTDGQKVTKGTKLTLNATVDEKDIDFVEEPTYNFYYVVSGDSKRNYIVKNVQSGYVWNTSKLDKFGEIEIHMTINIYIESGIQECLCDEKLKLNMVNVYEVTYMSNYEECNIYAMKFYCEDGKSIIVKEALFDRDGFYFEGWNSSSDGKGQRFYEGEEIFVNDDTQLYAVWREKTNNLESAKPQTTKNPTASAVKKTEGTKVTNKGTVSSSGKNLETKKGDTNIDAPQLITIVPNISENNKDNESETKETTDTSTKPNNILPSSKVTLNSEEPTEETVDIPANKVEIGTKKDVGDKKDDLINIYVMIAVITVVVGTASVYVYKRYQKKK